jgi:hypothetical protein
LHSETFLERFGAGAVEEVESIGGVACGDEEVGVVAIEGVAVGEEWEAAFFIGDRGAFVLERGDGFAVPEGGLGRLVAAGVEIGEGVLGLPAEGWKFVRLGVHLLEDGFGLGAAGTMGGDEAFEKLGFQFGGFVADAAGGGEGFVGAGGGGIDLIELKEELAEGGVGGDEAGGIVGGLGGLNGLLVAGLRLLEFAETIEGEAGALQPENLVVGGADGAGLGLGAAEAGEGVVEVAEIVVGPACVAERGLEEGVGVHVGGESGGGVVAIEGFVDVAGAEGDQAEVEEVGGFEE